MTHPTFETPTREPLSVNRLYKTVQRHSHKREPCAPQSPKNTTPSENGSDHPHISLHYLHALEFTHRPPRSAASVCVPHANVHGASRAHQTIAKRPIPLFRQCRTVSLTSRHNHTPPPVPRTSASYDRTATSQQSATDHATKEHAAATTKDTASVSPMTLNAVNCIAGDSTLTMKEKCHDEVIT